MELTLELDSRQPVLDLHSTIYIVTLNVLIV